jgi:RepB DNA-primase from phage plasmid/Protein of unknown function (DUF3987)
VQPGVFFKEVFGTASGYLCIAQVIRRPRKEFKESFYKYPDQLSDAHEYIERNKYSGDVYFCAQLLSEPKRNKAHVAYTTCAWSDLDTCPPTDLLVQPTIVLETSTGRFQAFWSFEEAHGPHVGEGISRRIAYYHADAGADRSGWDLTQLLRVPGTRNFKYGDGASAPEVRVIQHNQVRYREADFDTYPETVSSSTAGLPMPTYLHQPGIKILERYAFKMSGSAHTMFHEEAKEGDRSQTLFRLEMECLEAGMTPADVFQVARDAACNKWKDEPELLWNDICRALATHQDNLSLQTVKPDEGPELITDEERKAIGSNPSFIERYVQWARTLGDAAPQYHEAGAFIALSAILSSSVRLPTSFGAIIPNLWLMILADTTLTRKSTAMNTVMDMLEGIDETLLMATDGSIEGFATALSERQGKVSIFFRDEFTGLLEAMTKKDYLAGTPEFFTGLYDGKTQKRRLRKEEIHIKDPRLIIFAGGIKGRMQSLVTFEHVSSGFLPRFIFATAEADPNKIKPLGPPQEQNTEGRDEIQAELKAIYDRYVSTSPIMVGAKCMGMASRTVDASLTPEAWNRFNLVDKLLREAGLSAGDLKDVLIPLYARLAFSMLKASVLIAASRSENGSVIVEEEDVVRAAYYGEKWRRDAQDVITNIGKGPFEHKIQLIRRAVERRGRVARSYLMNSYHLTAREMSDIARTLQERGLINVTMRGKEQIFQTTLSEKERLLND